MAVCVEEPDSGRKRKRKVPRGKRKFLVDEKVEVRSVEDGFLGSWHPGTVIAYKTRSRAVKYDHLLTDDGSKNLVDIVGVSSTVDGISCANVNQCNYRGYIRPVPPPLELGKWGLPYGLCVDVYYQEAWWEGVIFDHEDGSEERMIFFPDLGDEMCVGIGSLRITQDWSEFTETWHRRGTWLFLELIEEYEREQCIPVSVKQIWYDLREKRGFKKVGEWTSSGRGLWKELVLEVIGDNMKITVNYFLHVLGCPGSLQKEIKPLLVSSKRSSDGNICLEADLAESRALVLVENPLDTGMRNPRSASFQPAQEEYGLHELLSVSEDDWLKMNLLEESNGSCHHGKAVCVKPPALPVLSSSPDRISVISCITNGDRLSSTKSSKINGKPRSLTRRNIGNWLPAGSDIVPGAEFCPDTVTKYASGNKQSRKALMIDVRKHLKHMRWTIESTIDASNIFRLRYASPDGKYYYSLRQVCLDLMKEDTPDIPSLNFQSNKISLHTSPNDSLYPSPDQPLENQDHDYCTLAVASSSSDILLVEPAYCPQAVVEWSKLEPKESQKKNLCNNVTKLKAKKHLSALGWVFQYRISNGRRWLQYTSPRGRSFCSLRVACKRCIAEGDFESSGSTYRTAGNGNVSEEVEGHLANEKLSSAVSNEEIQKGLVQSNGLFGKWSLESSCISQPTNLVDFGGVKVQGMQKLQRKRKSSSHHECLLIQKQAKSHAQNTSLPKLKRRKASGTSIKLRDDLVLSQPTRVLRSSKRVQQVVTPSPSHQNPRTVLSWLIDNNVVLPRAKVQYRKRKDWSPLAEGRITRDGIKCNCCGKVYTLNNFEAHTGSTYHRPAAHIFLEDGKSLLKCQRQAMDENKMRNKAEAHNRLKSNWRQGENDYICSVCHYGGELILCDQCPSSFHKSCLGLKVVPDGDWFCPSCCCRICGQSKVKEDTKHFRDNRVLSCVQCDHKYHIGCLHNRGADKLETYLKDNWFCNEKCEEIFFSLEKHLGKPIPVGADNLTWTIMKSLEYDHCELDASDIEAENHSKLNVALSVMHECFESLKEPHTKRDLVEDVIFSRRSELKRLNFRGFYTILLERNDELITVASVRVYGKKVAEVPLVGTRFQYRRLGMCRILMDELEKKLIKLGVERLVLPAVPSVLNTWTASFGFSKMTDFERLQFVDYTFLDFQDTVMCQKLLMKSPPAESSPSKGNEPELRDYILTSGDKVDLDGSSAVSKVFQGYQIEESRIMDKGIVDTHAGYGSSVSERPLHLVVVAKQPVQLECEPCLGETSLVCSVEDANLRKESRFRGLKCYKRRKVSAS